MVETSSLVISHDGLKEKESCGSQMEVTSPVKDAQRRDSATELLHSIEKAAEIIRISELASSSEKVIVADKNRKKSENFSVDMTRHDSNTDAAATVSVLRNVVEGGIHDHDQIIRHPGAVRVRPPGSISSHAMDEDIEFTDHTDIEEGDKEIQLEATLVVPEDVYQNANVKPALVAEAEPIDENFLKRLRKTGNENRSKRRKRLIIFVLIPILIFLSVGIFLAVYFTQSNDSSSNDNVSNDNIMNKDIDSQSDQKSRNELNNDNDTNNGMPSQNGGNQNNLDKPYYGNQNINIFERITQHAVIFKAEMDCEDVISEISPPIFMRIQCFSPNGIRGKEAIQFESASPNVNCTRMRPNNLECNATFSSNVTQFYTIFTCGTPPTNSSNTTDLSTANVQKFPLSGVSCAKEAVLNATMVRFCGNSSNDAVEIWSLSPALSEDSCQNNYYKEFDKWPFCRAYDSCDQMTCLENLLIPEIVAFDSILDQNCENPGGYYTPIDLQRWKTQIDAILMEM